MSSNLGFVVKVLLVSALLALAIKYGGPMLVIPATTLTALIAILLPPAVVAIALGWRAWQYSIRKAG